MQTTIPNSPIQFRFRCSAFGVHYYDCIGREFPTFEVCHTGMDIDANTMAPRYGWDGRLKPAGFDEACQAYFDIKRREYAEWREQHAHLFADQAS